SSPTARSSPRRSTRRGAPSARPTSRSAWSRTRGPSRTRGRPSARRRGSRTRSTSSATSRARAPLPSDRPLVPRATATRNAYAELLRDTRGLRREQQQAREAWFARLAADKKDETLFELEILLKGIACFANPRNHPGAGRRQTIVSHDFHE